MLNQKFVCGHNLHFSEILLHALQLLNYPIIIKHNYNSTFKKLNCI